MAASALESLAHTVPVRLTPTERSLQTLLVAALNVSEYTNKVDVVSYSRDKTIVNEVWDFLQTILALSIPALKKDKGRKMLMKAAKEASDCTSKEIMMCCKDFYADLFEIARRYKRMNPDKMRSEYGKLISLMQDVNRTRIRHELGNMDLVKDCRTVYSVLKEHDLLDLLSDPDLEKATTPLDRMDAGDIEVASKEKEALIAELSKKYGMGRDDENGRAVSPVVTSPSSGAATRAEIVELCLRSLDDGKCFLRDNAANLDKLIGYLKHYFDPVHGVLKGSPKGDISIQSGKGGSCLTHSHSQHYGYVLESLTLWKVIMKDIFHLWSCVDRDMLDSRSDYQFRYTGQGHHRVKSAPETGSAMRRNIAKAQAEMGGRWVGSQVVHLGDNDVPNALVFIDKYTQVPRIVNPIVKVIENIDSVSKLPGQESYLVNKFGSVENC
eukprot:Sspe_Gene.75441::Locus_47137_Transcript_1_1_Confidence_1.000_Length_1374::g.75441::m.75441